jgi:hypothetical protein
MSAQGVVEDSAPAKHSMRVEWFRRDPGGGTIFVSSARNSDGTPAHSDGNHAVQAATNR